MANEAKGEGIIRDTGVVSFTNRGWRILAERPSLVGDDGSAYGENGAEPASVGRRSFGVGDGSGPPTPGHAPETESGRSRVDILNDWSPPALVAVARRVSRLLDSAIPGRHVSLVYCVPYEYEGRSVHTFVRLDIPRVYDLDKSFLPLALLVDGGKAVTSAVRARAPDYGEHKLTEDLASGAAGSTEGDFPVRDGDPMVVVSFTQPGRGGVNESGRPEYLGNRLLMASPNPAYVDSTPGNLEGQDCGGMMTVAAMNAVMGVAQAVLEDMVAAVNDVHGAPTPELRIVVASVSFGLASASHWIRHQVENDGFVVHALVDWEGPADSLDITLASLCTAPFEAPFGKDYLGWGWDDAFRPSYETWADWFGGAWNKGEFYPDAFFFRPPKVVLEQLDGSEESLPQGEPISLDAMTAGYVRSFYGEEVWDLERKRELLRYWREREPVEHLPYLGCPYIRIQAGSDHIQPDWMHQRHAVKAINAAREAGQRVYGAGADFVDDWAFGPAAPSLVGESQDAFGTGSWPNWLVAPVKGWSGTKTFVMIDLVRWAMVEEFYSSPPQAGGRLHPWRDRVSPRR
jgi:hypothetical protein